MIKTATFVKSCPSVKLCPVEQLPEYAFIGRSNVGKSSLINMLCSAHELAMTSSKPGKTLLINYFLINEKWHLVDLPGYGYAKVNKNIRGQLEGMIKSYILQREQLTCLFLLIDSRLEPQRIDLEFINFLGENGIPFCLVFTKTDKLSKTAFQEHLEVYKQKLLESWESLPPIFATSSEKGLGKEELTNYIETINQQLTEQA